MYFEDGEPLFPFYWTSNPRLIKGAVYERLSDFERETVAYLETLNQMSIMDLLSAESTPTFLESYLKDMATIDEAQRLKLLKRARAKKAQPDDKVDVVSKLEVAEGNKKKKRKVESVRISVLVPSKVPSPAAAAVDEAVEAGGETKVKLWVIE